ncbi:MAG: rhodanese-like domain-containing protein [Mogibacterium sp.]|nr:rhodanese-like domain-containing protein [Mogibacterium sp.]
MGFFDFFMGPNINEGLEKFQKTPGAVLLDVREPNEYVQGRIPQSKNLPLDKIDRIGTFVPDKNTPIFTYCLAGTRSSRAVAYLKSQGYTSVTNIGGINRYKGRIV